MLINDTYEIKRENRFNICLYKKTTVKTGERAGEIEWVNMGYYWDGFPAAVRGAIKVLGMDKITYQGDIKDVIRELSKVKRMISRIQKEVAEKAPKTLFCSGCMAKKKGVKDENI